MRLLTFEHSGTTRIGAMDGDQVADLTAADPDLPTDMVEIISDWSLPRMKSAFAVAPRLSIDEVKILAPLQVRKNIIAVGKNYRDHAAEFSKSGFDASEKQLIPDDPVVFTKAPTSVIGPDDAIELANDPTGTTDYEGEMGVVIGKVTKNVSKQDALDYVFGWTIVNDVTARDLQKRHVQWFIGKSPDTFCPMGPCITTRDELPD